MMDCYHCGEPLGDEALAEIYLPADTAHLENAARTLRTLLSAKRPDHTWVVEVWDPADDPEPNISGGFRSTEPPRSRVVHAEPCATELLSKGWEIA